MTGTRLCRDNIPVAMLIWFRMKAFDVDIMLKQSIALYSCQKEKQEL